jgi:hypothetical protein
MECRYRAPHAVSGAELLERFRSGRIRLWALNREIDLPRARAIARSLDQCSEPWALGPVPVQLAATGGETFILDGQHRIAALGLVARPEKFQVFVVESALASPDELMAEFEKINCGAPVPATYWCEKMASELGRFLDELSRAFPGTETVSSLSRTSRPRWFRAKVLASLNECSALIEALRAGEVNSRGLLAAAFVENDRVSALAASNAFPDLRPRCLKMAASTNFYLGLDKIWPLRVATSAVETARRARDSASVSAPASDLLDL